jgi:hypothetical protein
LALRDADSFEPDDALLEAVGGADMSADQYVGDFGAPNRPLFVRKLCKNNLRRFYSFFSKCPRL